MNTWGFSNVRYCFKSEYYGVLIQSCTIIISPNLIFFGSAVFISHVIFNCLILCACMRVC